MLDEQGKDHTIHVVRKYRCNACRGWHLTSWENYGAPEEAAPAAPAVPARRDPLMISLAGLHQAHPDRQEGHAARPGHVRTSRCR